MAGHADRAHAELGPSSAARWLSCTASPRLIKELEAVNNETRAARQGTLAHEAAEWAARREFFDTEPDADEYARWLAAVDEEFPGEAPDMLRHAKWYAEKLRAVAEDMENPSVLIESRVYPEGVEGCFGTADAILYDDSGNVAVCDYKYGVGLRVDAPGNPQLLLYALGTMALIDGIFTERVEGVSMHIFQPRLNHVSSSNRSATSIRQWRDAVVEKALKEMEEGGTFRPSSEACRWCPALSGCKAAADFVLKEDFGETEFTSHNDLSDALDVIPMIEAWVKAVKAKAFNVMYVEGRPITGWKVVAGTRRRKVVNEQGAIDILKGEFPDTPIDTLAPRKLAGLPALDRLVGGKDALAEILGDTMVVGAPTPSIVDAADPREGITEHDEIMRDFAPQA